MQPRLDIATEWPEGSQLIGETVSNDSRSPLTLVLSGTWCLSSSVLTPASTLGFCSLIPIVYQAILIRLMMYVKN